MRILKPPSAVQGRTAVPERKPPEPTQPTGRGWVASSRGAPPKANGYGVTLPSKPGDWHFQDEVRAFQAQVPPDVQRSMQQASPQQLRQGVSKSWTQDITHDGKTEKMTVELTRKLIPVPYEQFTARIPPAQWGGPNLARYLGGEVQPLSFDEQGRPTRQVERMVLAQDDLTPLLGEHAQRLAGKFANDMTKAETISYGKDRARVDWRVFGSNNGSTLQDLGSVTFEKSGEGTLVTFHSAHQLGVPGTSLIGAPPIGLPAELVRQPLENAFLAHANQ